MAIVNKNKTLNINDEYKDSDECDLEASLTGVMKYKGFFLEWAISRELSGENEEDEEEFVGSNESQEMGFTVDHKGIVYDFGPTYCLDVKGYAENPRWKKNAVEAFNINASLISFGRAAYHLGVNSAIGYFDWSYEWSSICQQIFGVTPINGYYGEFNESAWVRHADLDSVSINSINHHFGTNYDTTDDVDDFALINFLYKNKDADINGSANATLIMNSMDEVLRKVFKRGNRAVTLKALKAYPLQHVPGFADQEDSFDSKWLESKSFDTGLKKLTKLYRNIGFSCKNEYGQDEYLLARKVK